MRETRIQVLLLPDQVLLTNVSSEHQLEILYMMMKIADKVRKVVEIMIKLTIISNILCNIKL